MGAKKRYSLQRTMIIYFLLIGFASLLVGIEFLSDFHGGNLKNEIWENINQADDHPVDQEAVFSPIDRMRSKAMLMVGIIMVVILIVLTMFIRHITEPLQHMIGISEKISSGDLSHTIRIDAHNELAELGRVINETASNLQEIIMLSNGLCANGRRHIENALKQLDREHIDAKHVDSARQSIYRLKMELDTLSEFVACFEFYSVDRHDFE